LLLTALSVGSTGAFLLGCAALLSLAFSLLSVVLAALTCRIQQTAECSKVVRREQVAYTLSVHMICPLPIAPLSLRFLLPSGRETSFLLTRTASSLMGLGCTITRFMQKHFLLFALMGSSDQRLQVGQMLLALPAQPS
jgi:hypothetical protein